MSFGLLSPVAGGARDPESGLPASFVGVTDSGLPVYRVGGEEFVQFPPRPVLPVCTEVQLSEVFYGGRDCPVCKLPAVCHEF